MRRSYSRKLLILLSVLVLPLLTWGAISKFDFVKANRLDVDNVRVDGNTISTTNSNGDLTLDMNGTGSVILTDLSASTALGLDASKKITSVVQTSPNEITNCSIATSVGSNALTIALKDGSGSDPSTSSACKISFRDATAATGSYSQVSVTAATSVVVSSGSTLGTTSGAAAMLYVYAINNSGTVELGVINGLLLDESAVQSSTAEGGAGAADTIGTLYSTTARTSKAVRLVGQIAITEATAGTWASNATTVYTTSNTPKKNVTIQTFTSGTAQTYTTPAGVKWLRVRMVGGGGGGGGTGTGVSGTTGYQGDATTFGASLTANGGQPGGGGGQGTGGTGGECYNGDFGAWGFTGQGTSGNDASYVDYGGSGGGTVLMGGGGSGGNNAPSAGGNGQTNTGAGGGGAGGQVNIYAATGGGGGAYCEKVITNPAATYTYTVGGGGTGGTAGTSGAAGGNGAAGIIIVEEHY